MDPARPAPNTHAKDPHHTTPRITLVGGCPHQFDGRFELATHNRGFGVGARPRSSRFVTRTGSLGRRFGFEHHGGLIDSGRFRSECLERMLRAVEQHHGVTRDQIGVARAQRDLRFHAAVTLMFVPFYLRAS